MMNSNRLSFLGSSLAVVLALGMPVVVAQTTKASSEAPRTASVMPAEERKVEGTIAERNGDRLTLRLAATDTDLVVKLSGFTRVQEKRTNPFRRGRKYQASQLVPGLNVIVEGRGDSDGALLAEKIRFTDDQFKSARTVDVRMSPVEENARKMSGQLSELEAVSNAARGGARAAQDSADKAHDRITSLDDYEAVRSITVRFKAGSAQLSEEAKRSLDEMAQQAKSRKGYVIEVAGIDCQHPCAVETLSGLAQLYARQGKYAEAESLFGRALAILEQWQGREHPDTLAAAQDYADLLEKMQREEERT